MIRAQARLCPWFDPATLDAFVRSRTFCAPECLSLWSTALVRTVLGRTPQGAKGTSAPFSRLRSNIAVHARNSAEAKATWVADQSIDVWLIWNIWQVASPDLADVIPIAPEYAVYRDAGIAVTTRGKEKPQAQKFVNFLQSPAGAAIFSKWGWKTN